LSFSPDKTAFFFARVLPPRAMAAALSVADLSVRRGGRRVLDKLSFTLDPGSLLALTGRNGTGKTTLLRALALLVPGDGGEIRWNGASVADDREAWRARLAWLGHNDGLKGDLTVAENLVAAERLRSGRTLSPTDALSAFDLANLAQRPARALSAGQRRRAALARVVLSAADLWLLDEPLNALDAPAQESLRIVLRAHLARGGMAIAATHAPLGLDGARSLELAAQGSGS
jgi:heme exporter protein A